MNTNYANACWYRKHNIVPIPVEHGGKKCLLPDWPNFVASDENLQKHFNGSPTNIAAVLGPRSNWLISVDLDSITASNIAPLLLAESWSYGRVVNNVLLTRQVFFICEDIKTKTWQLPKSLRQPGQKDTIIEILAKGKCAVVPPSMHASGHPIVWINRPDEIRLATTNADELTKQVATIAGASVLAEVWPTLSNRHYIVGALTGACLHAGWEPERIAQVMHAICLIANDEELRDRMRFVDDTITSFKAGEQISGLPTLSEYLECDSDVINFLVKTWCLDLDVTEIYKPSTIEATVPTEAWPKIIPLNSSQVKPDYPPYPIDATGEIIGGAISAIADRQQAPIPLTAQAVLTAAATAAHALFDVVVDERVYPLSLWMVAIAASGERKSSTDKLSNKQIIIRQTEALIKYRTSYNAWKEDKEGARPRAPIWLLSDATTEGLTKSLDENWPAVTLANNDAASWLHGYSMRDGKEHGNMATTSQLWSGDTITSMRASKAEPSNLAGRRLNMSLMLQPIYAATMLENNTLLGQGFLSRCLPCFPESTIGSRLYKAIDPNDKRLDKFNTHLDVLLSKRPPFDIESGILSPEPLELSASAYNTWVNIYNEYEIGLQDKYKDYQEVVNKAAEQVLRLAGVFSAIENPEEKVINEALINRAKTIVDWYLNEWLSMSERLQYTHPEHFLPAQLLEWMLKKYAKDSTDIFTPRMIYQGGLRKLRNYKQSTQDTLETLVEHGYLVLVAANRYQLNPNIDK